MTPVRISWITRMTNKMMLRLSPEKMVSGGRTAQYRKRME